MRKAFCTFSLLCVIAALFAVTGCNRAQQTSNGNEITIKGSNTMVLLVTGWAEAYMAKNPDANIKVSGIGSGPGIEALLNKTTDICSASRQMKPEEMQEAKSNGLTVKEYTVARDAISVIVNPDNPIKEVTMGQLSDIFTGKIANWKQLGGPDEEIVVYTREAGSGTNEFFVDHVLKKQDFAKSARSISSPAGIIESVSQDKGDIGIVGLGNVAEAKANVKVLAVKKDDKSPAVTPTVATVKNGSYSISRPLYLYTTDAAPAITTEFINFCLSPDGQKIVETEGFITAK